MAFSLGLGGEMGGFCGGRGGRSLGLLILGGGDMGAHCPDSRCLGEEVSTGDEDISE